MNRIRVKTRKAFTLVELLVVVAVIGLLVALLLPAVQGAREAGRRASCKSNLRQLGLGLANFHEIQKAYPHGGWGRAWVPVPDRGLSLKQPGGWAYQVLPYIEEGIQFDAIADGGVARVDTSPSIFNCPSRRPSRPLPAGNGPSYQRTPRPSGVLDRVARGDYAINAGSSHAFRFTGPPSLPIGDTDAFWESITDNREFTGISHLRRATRIERVLDGLSKTYLVGEKFLAPQHYDSGQSLGDDETLFSGYANDNHRFAATRPAGPPGEPPDSIVYYAPLRDTNQPALDPAGHWRFGSAHNAGCHMLYCDGSVRVVDFSVDVEVHYYGGHRSDGNDLVR